jgi:hypothetical protein
MHKLLPQEICKELGLPPLEKLRENYAPTVAEILLEENIKTDKEKYSKLFTRAKELTDEITITRKTGEKLEWVLPPAPKTLNKKSDIKPYLQSIEDVFYVATAICQDYLRRMTRMGHNPDPCCVPIINLQTGTAKMFRFR